MDWFSGKKEIKKTAIPNEKSNGKNSTNKNKNIKEQNLPTENGKENNTKNCNCKCNKTTQRKTIFINQESNPTKNLTTNPNPTTNLTTNPNLNKKKNNKIARRINNGENNKNEPKSFFPKFSFGRKK